MMKPQSVAKRLLVLLSFVMVLSFTLGVGPPDRYADSHYGSADFTPRSPNTGGIPGVDSSEHTVECHGTTGGKIEDYDAIYWWADNLCTDGMSYLNVEATLQKRAGFWPIYWWQNIQTTVPDYCDDCFHVFTSGTRYGLASGKYRNVGEFWMTWPFEHGGPTYGTDVTCCWDL